jgi:multimeric flavodoxin WrbA
MKRKLTKLEPLEKNPDEYDLVIIGTPVWAWNMSVPIRTYLSEQKDNLKNKVAFFCTMGGSGDKKSFLEMQNLLDKNPIATLALTTKEVVSNNFSGKMDKFADEINLGVEN